MTVEEVTKLLNEIHLSNCCDDFSTRQQLRRVNALSGVHVTMGMTKVCLLFESTNFVIKWSPEGKNRHNEAFREYEIYNQAVKEGLEMFFPKTEILGTWDNIVVIIQDRVDFSFYQCPFIKLSYYKRIGRTVTDKIYYKATLTLRDNRDEPLNRTWVAMAISLYGKKRVKAFGHFVEMHQINDLHEANIGFKNNKPVILDFSGFHL